MSKARKKLRKQGLLYLQCPYSVIVRFHGIIDIVGAIWHAMDAWVLTLYLFYIPWIRGNE